MGGLITRYARETQRLAKAKARYDGSTYAVALAALQDFADFRIVPESGSASSPVMFTCTHCEDVVSSHDMRIHMSVQHHIYIYVTDTRGYSKTP